ncbi:hypothetical protein Pan97_25040 [Bremerella volcania]|uniref:GAF domain-containing protein n=1 Tax=Bremerella volcania TaxID=2527984 RepID=A0A518C8E0_9BACT|nr:GAF domain-containing protein [Bremerella volcania]QDU75472.1 hypothetical protein Pan97_25040 [Bremerella volcania]
MSIPIRIAVVQLSGPIDSLVGGHDFTSEPFTLAGDVPSLSRMADVSGEIACLAQEFRGDYLKWQKHRIEQILTWMRDEWATPENPGSDRPETPASGRSSARHSMNDESDGKQTASCSRMPDLIVFPEGGVPQDCLPFLVDFAKQTHTAIVAGTHSFRNTDPKAIATYQRVGVSHDTINSLVANVAGTTSIVTEIIPRVGKSPKVKLRRKQSPSPHERTDDYRNDKLVGIKIIKMRTRDGALFSFHTLVCSEALQHHELPDPDECKMIVIPSYNVKREVFDNIIGHYTRNKQCVVYCNTGNFGASSVMLPLDERGKSWWFSGKPSGELPQGDGILIVDVFVENIAVETAVNNPQKKIRTCGLASIVSGQEQSSSLEIAHWLKTTQLMEETEDGLKQINGPKLLGQIEDHLNRCDGNAIQYIKLQRLANLFRNGEISLSRWHFHAHDCIVADGVSLAEFEFNRAAKCEERLRGLRNRSDFQDVDIRDELEQILSRCHEFTGIRQREQRRKSSTRHDILPNMWSLLRQVTAESVHEASRRLYDEVAELVERYGATSGFLTYVPWDESNKTPKKLVPCVTYNCPMKPSELEIAADDKEISATAYVAKYGKGIVHDAIEFDMHSDRPNVAPYQVDIESTKSLISVPIFLRDGTRGSDPQVIGVLSLESNSKYAFDWHMLGLLKSDAECLVKDLVVIQTANKSTSALCCHPGIHGSGLSGLVKRFCYELSTLVGHVATPPRIGCTVWIADWEKNRFNALGTAGFDYLYQKEKWLPLVTPPSSSDEVDTNLEEDLINFTSLVLHSPKGSVRHRHFTEAAAELRTLKRKARKVELQSVKGTPIYLEDSAIEGRLSQGNKPIGVLDLFFFSPRYGIGLVDVDEIFNDRILVQLAELVARMIAEYHALQSKISCAKVATVLFRDGIHGSDMLDALRLAMGDIFDSDACSIFASDLLCDEIKSLKCVSTTGLVHSGSPENVTSSAAYHYDLEDDPYDDDNPIGMTRYLGFRGGRSIRKNDVPDMTERVYSGNHERRRLVNVSPGFKYAEKVALTPVNHYRFLGASVATHGPSPDKPSAGVIRVNRRRDRAPYLELDEVLLQKLVKMCQQSLRYASDHLQSENQGFHGGANGKTVHEAAMTRLASPYCSRYWNWRYLNGILSDLLLVAAQAEEEPRKPRYRILANLSLAGRNEEGWPVMKMVAYESTFSSNRPTSAMISHPRIGEGNRWWATTHQKLVVAQFTDGVPRSTAIVPESRQVRLSVCLPFHFKCCSYRDPEIDSFETLLHYMASDKQYGKVDRGVLSIDFASDPSDLGAGDLPSLHKLIGISTETSKLAVALFNASRKALLLGGDNAPHPPETQDAPSLFQRSPHEAIESLAQVILRHAGGGSAYFQPATAEPQMTMELWDGQKPDNDYPFVSVPAEGTPAKEFPRIDSDLQTYYQRFFSDALPPRQPHAEKTELTLRVGVAIAGTLFVQLNNERTAVLCDVETALQECWNWYANSPMSKSQHWQVRDNLDWKRDSKGVEPREDYATDIHINWSRTNDSWEQDTESWEVTSPGPSIQSPGRPK